MVERLQQPSLEPAQQEGLKFEETFDTVAEWARRCGTSRESLLVAGAAVYKCSPEDVETFILTGPSKVAAMRERLDLKRQLHREAARRYRERHPDRAKKASQRWESAHRDERTAYKREVRSRDIPS